MISGAPHEGMLRLGGDIGAPWLNHTKVYFVTKEEYGDGHPKNKIIKEYTPEDIEGYITHTEDKEGNRIEMIFITDVILLEKGLSRKNTKVFLRRIEDGAVAVYTFVPIPDSGPQDYDAAIRLSTTYFKKGDGAAISAVESDMSTLLAECPDVVAKIKSGAYGFQDLNDREKKKGLGKIMTDSYGDNAFEAQIQRAVTDYNACMK